MMMTIREELEHNKVSSLTEIEMPRNTIIKHPLLLPHHFPSSLVPSPSIHLLQLTLLLQKKEKSKLKAKLNLSKTAKPSPPY
jgi:hypothetical protein